MKKKCLPCALHGVDRKPIKEVVDPISAKLNVTLKKLEDTYSHPYVRDVDKKKDQKIDKEYGDAYETYYKELLNNGITVVTDDDKLYECINEKSFFEFYYERATKTYYIREIKGGK